MCWVDLGVNEPVTPGLDLVVDEREDVAIDDGLMAARSFIVPHIHVDSLRMSTCAPQTHLTTTTSRRPWSNHSACRCTMLPRRPGRCRLAERAPNIAPARPNKTASLIDGPSFQNVGPSSQPPKCKTAAVTTTNTAAPAPPDHASWAVRRPAVRRLRGQSTPAMIGAK